MKFSFRKASLGFALPSLLGLGFVVVGPLSGCRYEFKENHNYAKENRTYLDPAANAAFEGLLIDARIKAVLEGGDAQAKGALETQLDTLRALQADADGVVYAILLEAIQADEGLTAANVAANLTTVVRMIESQLVHDQQHIIAEVLRDDPAADAARVAFQTYSNERSSANIQAMIDSCFNAIEQQLAALQTSAPIATALIYAASSKAIEGENSIDKVKEALPYVNKTPSGDVLRSSQRSGPGLIAVVIRELTEVFKAADASEQDTALQSVLVLAIAESINSAGLGLSQLATVVAARVEKNMIDSGRSREEITIIMNSLPSMFQQLVRNTETARNIGASQSDSELGQRIKGLIAEMIQLVSLMRTEQNAKDVTASIDGLDEALATANGDATRVAEILKERNSDLAVKLGVGTESTVPTYTVGGTVSGLNGTLALRNNGGDELTISMNGSFVFATKLADGADFAVTIATQPNGQTCSLSQATGKVNTANVTTVTVSCESYYAIGGTVSGLSGTLVLKNNATDTKSITSNGSYAFDAQIAAGGTYAVTVQTQPVNQTCIVSNGSGTISTASVTNISVSCVDNFKRIAATTATFNGKMNGNPANVAAAIALADAACVSEFGNNYKALLMSSVRAPGTDWVLAANMEYRRYDSDTVIGTTDASAVFPGASLDTNPISAGATHWTGKHTGAWTVSAQNCSDWTSSGSSGTDADRGKWGNSFNNSVDGAFSLSVAGQHCGLLLSLYCIQQ